MDTQILDAMRWRFATKKFDATKKLTAVQLDSILEPVRLSASSFGLQPWHFVVVSNQEVKLKLQTAAYGQAQLADASHIVVFTAKLDVMKALDDYVASTAENRGVAIEELAGMKEYMAGSFNAKTDAPAWMARQPYIALGTLLETAALLQIDACPMEGFDPAQFDEILGLKEKGLTSVCIAALGFRSSEDATANVPKNRFSREKAFTFID